MSDYSKIGRIDVSAPPGAADDGALAALTARVSDVLGWPEESVRLLAAPPDGGWRAFEAALEAGGEAPVRLPPEDAGVFAALDGSGPLPARLAALACLNALKPAGLASLRESWRARDAMAEAWLPALNALEAVAGARFEAGVLTLEADDATALDARLKQAGLVLRTASDTTRIAYLPDAASARRFGQALGLTGGPARAAQRRRTTKETDILVAVDLDGEGADIATGIAFYDHMLEQIAAHGGFALTVSGDGDLDVDAHHTIEDVAIAVGEAIAEALGDKAGIGRYGFTAPMDEAQASVAIDLSGRPLIRFDGNFVREAIGGFPTEMTPHVFRSLADSLRAAVHIRVEGEDDHHKIEACFKGFGRALRQAIRREGEALPSTKGVL